MTIFQTISQFEIIMSTVYSMISISYVFSVSKKLPAKLKKEDKITLSFACKVHLHEMAIAMECRSPRASLFPDRGMDGSLILDVIYLAGDKIESAELIPVNVSFLRPFSGSWRCSYSRPVDRLSFRSFVHVS